MGSTTKKIVGGVVGAIMLAAGAVTAAAPAQAGVAYAYVTGPSFQLCEHYADRYMARQGGNGYDAAFRTTCAKSGNVWKSKVTLSY
ncbi:MULTISPECIES: hypothetical protein [unclassified Pseudoclavibacter]|uniref:hypothetical protein n=1 Tax=unclassified Pseudoclavibacter TaxID=2615177 RepID=UPI000CE8F105|nr:MULTISPECIES: hypothetical protein [unclassified Pseudoclavibacter]MBF4549296.1 hypothetical protein [Pseudoclavibacter sp. VKM Ac-2888]PPF40011.1 hypothetical protein C5E05_02010 [Pseudoclavibacter sp. AY1H1]PPG02887.1 hypothetical protein C5E06_10620 [Pseudoclavibacter sp. RFBI5]